MKAYLIIGPSPHEEDCVQLGSPNYYADSMRECQAFIKLIRNCVGEEPEGAILRVKSFPHDFGTYHEVVCWYETNSAEATEYAYRVESEAPARWVVEDA